MHTAQNQFIDFYVQLVFVGIKHSSEEIETIYGFINEIDFDLVDSTRLVLMQRFQTTNVEYFSFIIINDFIISKYT